MYDVLSEITAPIVAILESKNINEQVANNKNKEQYFVIRKRLFHKRPLLISKKISTILWQANTHYKNLSTGPFLCSASNRIF